MLNYGFGLTRIGLLHFVTVTFLCIFPRVIAYSYAGYTGRKAIAGEEIQPQMLLIMGLLILIILLPYLFIKLRSNDQQHIWSKR